eukprot:TRINITY_DN45744_c0_g1_i1.p1 TRINITY_DN45744_c0_g1~~TRINITY_DN45744_c0_g1_i1.p1  ORF type:complete len:430 (-),score=78.14 TRINITY_DN45744_c0_g1_i1:120-1409(-)
MSVCRDRLWLMVSMVALLVGWLLPSFASKAWGPSLDTFLRDSPLTAALAAQSAFVLLLALPRAKRESPGAAAEGGTAGFADGGDVETAGARPTAAGRARCVLPWSLPSLKCALGVGLLLFGVHSAWYSSMPRTSVATNTVLWNTDTVTTPMLAAALSWQFPSSSVMLGGLLGLIGACLSVTATETGDTSLGCGLVFAASVGYGVHTLMVEKVMKNTQLSVVTVLGLEGVVALVALAAQAAYYVTLTPAEMKAWLMTFPEPWWLAVMMVSCLMLNIGWLWCSELVDASWTAMAACMTIPVSMVLDIWMLNVWPEPIAILGGFFVFLGFLVTSGLTPSLSCVPLPLLNMSNNASPCPNWAFWRSASEGLLPPAEATPELSAVGEACTEDAETGSCTTTTKESAADPELDASSKSSFGDDAMRSDFVPHVGA